MELVRLPQAAHELGVSYPTIKQWIYARKIRSMKTAGGHHRIPRTEIDRLLFRGKGSDALEQGEAVRKGPAQGAAPIPSMSGFEHWISGRNQLVGRVTLVKTVGLLAKVSLDVGGQTVTSIITCDACRDLKLKVGQRAAALIKATEVMIIRPASGKD